MKTHEISNINEILIKLPPKRIKEVRDYVSYLLEKEKKHRAMVHRVLEAEKEPYVECRSAEGVMQAIYQAQDEDH